MLDRRGKRSQPLASQLAGLFSLGQQCRLAEAVYLFGEPQNILCPRILREVNLTDPRKESWFI